MKKILKIIFKIVGKIKRKLAIRRLRKHYENLLIVETIMEEWISTSIINRQQQGRRKELKEKQDRIKEITLFVDYLKHL